MNRPILFACAAACAPFAAALAASPGVTFSADHKIVTVHSASGHYTAPLSHAGLTPIFENLASLDPLGVYMAGTGYGISGPQGALGITFLASAFTPAANATVAEIDVAAGYISGVKTGLTITLYADAGGVPGKALWSGGAQLPLAGPCCALAAATVKGGLPVTGGTKYWIGLTTLPGGPDTFDSWMFNVSDQVDTGVMAENQGSGWVARQWLPNVAFGVYGK